MIGRAHAMRPKFCTRVITVRKTTCSQTSLWLVVALSAARAERHAFVEADGFTWGAGLVFWPVMNRPCRRVRWYRLGRLLE